MAQVRNHSAVIPASLAGRRLDQALSELFAEYSRTALKTWIVEGQVKLNAQDCRPRDLVQADDLVELTATLNASDGVAPERVEFAVVHADPDLIIVDKPAGVVVHPGAGNPNHTLVNGLLYRFPELSALPRAGLIHRLDKDTSGLLVVARSAQAFQLLVEQMTAREIHRSYDAIVNGVMVAGGTVEAAIGRDPVHRTRMRVVDEGREAVTHHRVIRRYRAHSHLEVHLETGRTHQIRVHMLHLGYPIVGDTTYGGRRKMPRNADPALTEALSALKRQALHAKRLAFVHPISGEDLRFESALPAELLALLAALGEDERAAASR